MTEPYVPTVITTRYDIEILTPESPYAPREWQQGRDNYYGQFYKMSGLDTVEACGKVIARINADVAAGYFGGDDVTIGDDEYRVVKVITISRVVS